MKPIEVALACGATTGVVLALAALNLQKKSIENKKLKIFDWNILAPMWIDIEEYKMVNGDLNLLHSDKRLLLIIDKILDSDADIVTLQEVQEDQYKVLSRELSHKYDTLGHTQHLKTYWTDEWLAEDAEVLRNGQVTFHRKGMFKVLRKNDFQSTEKGNILQIAVLQYTKSFCDLSKNTNVIIVNAHFESGMDDWKHDVRADQAKLIKEKIDAELQNLKGKGSNFAFVIGDFNTFGNFPEMQVVRDLGFVDCEEHLRKNNIRPTFIIVTPDEGQNEGIQLDHCAILESQLENEKILIKKFEVPDVTAEQYSPANHKNIVLNAFARRLDRLGISYKNALLDEKLFGILTHIEPSHQDFTESNPLRALRIGSDHLPLYAEFELSQV